MTRIAIALTLLAFVVAPTVKAIADDDGRDKKGVAARKPIDLEALGAELKAAVAAGKLTEAEALAKWMALTKKGEAGKDRKQVEEDDLEGIWKQLQAAVKAGKLTKEQAEAKMIAIKKGVGKKGVAEKKPVDLEELGAKLKAAVKAGELTEAEAVAKWTALTKKGEAGKDRKQVEEDDLEGIWKQLQAAVKAGKLTREQAEAKMAAIKKGAGKKGKAAKRPVDRKGLDARLEAAVKAGKLTREEADAKRAALKRGSKASRERGPFLPLDAGSVDEPQAARGLTTPPTAVSREGSDSTLIFGWAANATHRFMDNTHQGKPREIRAVSFRLDQREHDAIGRTWSNVTVRVAHGDWKSIRYNKSEEFTLVDESVKVFDQKWSFPAVTGKPPLTPASWGGLQSSLTFRLSKPWQYNGKDAIFLEFKFSGGTSHNGKPWLGQNPRGFEYFLDSMPEDGGWRKTRDSGAINYKAGVVPAATSYAAGSTPTEMSVWTSAAKGMPFIHYHD